MVVVATPPSFGCARECLTEFRGSTLRNSWFNSKHIVDQFKEFRGSTHRISWFGNSQAEARRASICAWKLTLWYLSLTAPHEFISRRRRAFSRACQIRPRGAPPRVPPTADHCRTCRAVAGARCLLRQCQERQRHGCAAASGCVHRRPRVERLIRQRGQGRVRRVAEGKQRVDRAVPGPQCLFRHRPALSCLPRARDVVSWRYPCDWGWTGPRQSRHRCRECLRCSRASSMSPPHLPCFDFKY